MEAVTWALTAYLELPQARQAAALWQRPASTDASSVLVGLSRYCRQIAQQFDLQGREAELHLRIIRALQAQSRAQPSADPFARQAVGAPVSSPLESSSATLMQRFLLAIEQHVAQEARPMYSPQRWRQSLIQHGRKVPPVAMQQACDWLWGRTSALHGDWPARGAGTRLINAAYVTMAEWLGPVRADACFTQIVREFEQSRDPALTNIRSYL